MGYPIDAPVRPVRKTWLGRFFERVREEIGIYFGDPNYVYRGIDPELWKEINQPEALALYGNRRRR